MTDEHINPFTKEVIPASKLVEDIINFRVILYKDRSGKVERTYPMEDSQTPDIITLSSTEVKALEKIMDFLGS